MTATNASSGAPSSARMSTVAPCGNAATSSSHPVTGSFSTNVPVGVTDTTTRVIAAGASAAGFASPTPSTRPATTCSGRSSLWESPETTQKRMQKMTSRRLGGSATLTGSFRWPRPPDGRSLALQRSAALPDPQKASPRHWCPRIRRDGCMPPASGEPSSCVGCFDLSARRRGPLPRSP